MEKEEMTTPSQMMNKLLEQGFKENFSVKQKMLVALESGRSFGPDQVKIINFYRFEGESDPADNSILYAIETSDGLKGLLTDAFGPYADSNISAFLTEVEDIAKKTNRDKKL